jgi:uncharacterized protein (DUF2225 family)
MKIIKTKKLKEIEFGCPFCTNTFITDKYTTNINKQYLGDIKFTFSKLAYIEYHPIYEFWTDCPVCGYYFSKIFTNQEDFLESLK